MILNWIGSDSLMASTGAGMGVMTLVGGLALFLFGMEQMTSALNLVAGRRMKQLLARLTNHRIKGIFTGMGVTALFQSSSVTSVLLVGFVSTGLLTLQQSLGVLLGAGVGSTITAQIIAFKVTRFGLLLIALGFLLRLMKQNEYIRYSGRFILGLGLIFFGMDLMGQATYPLRDFELFHELMSHLQNPFLGVLVGMSFTALVQSSAATSGIVVVLAGQQLLGFEAGISLIMGANVGTCITAMLASIGRPRAAWRVAWVHLVYKLLSILPWLWLIPQMAWMADWLTPGDGVESNLGRSLANANTFYSLANILWFVFLVAPVCKLVDYLLPDRKSADELAAEPRYLDANYLETPSLALDQVRREIAHLGRLVLHMVQEVPVRVLKGDRAQIQEAQEYDDRVDHLQSAILDYLGKLAEGLLSNNERQTALRYIRMANLLESGADVIDRSIIPMGLDRLKTGHEVSRETFEIIERLYMGIAVETEILCIYLETNEETMRQRVVEKKPLIKRLAIEASQNLAERLAGRDSEQLELFRLEHDTIEGLKQFFHFIRACAKIAGEAGPKGVAAAQEDDAENEESPSTNE